MRPVPYPRHRRTRPVPHPRERRPRVVLLIPAYNEADSIAATCRAAVAQNYPLTAVVVIANNCTDRTVEVARSVPGVTVIDLPSEPHKKAGSLNKMYWTWRETADYFICIDADTILPPESAGLWVEQMEAEPNLAGCSGRFTMQPTPGAPAWDNLLARMQKAEFARWTDKALRRGGKTSVLAGTACILRVPALDRLVRSRQVTTGYLEGPWFYGSLVEDYDLTYELRRLGYDTKVSYTVRAYTDAMTTLPALWAQRMKWQSGTVSDLMRQGVNKHTWREWSQQLIGLASGFVRFAWAFFFIVFTTTGNLAFHIIWFVLPVFFVTNDIKQSWRVPHRDWKDVLLAGSLLPFELFAWFRAWLWLCSYTEVIVEKLTGRQKDRWAMQARAEQSRLGAATLTIPAAGPPFIDLTDRSLDLREKVSA